MTTYTADIRRRLFEKIKTEAEDRVAKYPQYAGYFEGWVLVSFLTHRGLKPGRKSMWTVGELTIASLSTRDGKQEWTAYNRGSGWICALPVHSFEEVTS